ncbi:hypothetical protein FH972_023147 [Carpinus fangiana]|uniref:Zn(2)-C6 fungal-type domain-containing protein n=1 Tax=Carpinus fangiana TaxID=176857 RepID=A0A5N6KUD0_9ROSI|nr:hypothetical protein FH972_023147 [Carpinus fangiana]
MTKWSTGCDRCRQKKVKVCEGSQCPGYSRSPFEIKDETARTVQRIKEVSHAREEIIPVLHLPHHDMPEYVRHVHSLPPTMRIQMMNHGRENLVIFMQHIRDLYMPDEPNVIKGTHFSYIPTIATIESSDPTLVAARDAFAVVQLGTSHKNQVLLAHSRQLYGDALAKIRDVLTNRTRLFPQVTLVAITLVGLCEFFTAISQDGEGWNSHITGASQLLASWGSFSLDTPLARLVFNNLRNSIIIRGLITRQAVLFDSPVWLDQATQSSTEDPASSLNDIMVHIPALLEHSDRCLSKRDQQAITETLHGAWSLKRRLKTWYNRIQRDFGDRTYNEVDVASLPRFCADVKSRIFPSVFNFTSFHSAYQHCMYWLSNFILSDNDIRLIDACPPTDNFKPRLKKNQMKKERLQYVILICQSLPFCAERSAASIGRIGVLCPLWFCQEFFRSEQSMAHLAWCREVYEVIVNAGLSAPSIPLPKYSGDTAQYRTRFGSRF